MQLGSMSDWNRGEGRAGTFLAGERVSKSLEQEPRLMEGRQGAAQPEQRTQGRGITKAGATQGGGHLHGPGRGIAEPGCWGRAPAFPGGSAGLSEARGGVGKTWRFRVQPCGAG